MGLVNDQSGKIDLGIANGLQNNLIEFNSNFKIDLAAKNINRGRDHGIPAYAAYRQLAGLSSVSKFSDLSKEMSSANILKLQSVYE